MTIRVAVFGAGAVGAYFGARLHESGVDVSFVARGTHLDAIRRNGLKVESIAGAATVHPARVSDDPADIGPCDYVLLGVKAWQVRDAASHMGPLLKPGTVVVPLQNGVEAPFEIADVVGEQHVVGGTCGLVASIDSPGVIRHFALDPFIRFGELWPNDPERLRPLLEAFDTCRGVSASIPSDIRTVIWQKFLLIAPWSGVGAATRASIDRIRRVPATRQLLQSAMAEVAQLARRLDVSLPDDAVESTMAFVDNIHSGSTASMQRDIADGRPSELHYQNGAVVRLGGEAEIATPVNSFLYAVLLPSEQQARAEPEQEATDRDEIT